MTLLQKFIKLNFTRKCLYLEVVFWLAVSGLSVRMLPFRLVARILGKHMAQSEAKYDQDTLKKVQSVISAVTVAGRHVPWECKCLVQAITGKMVLKRKGIQSTLFLGIAKQNPVELSAHAWLKVDQWVVLGGGGLEKYAVVSTFS